MADSIDSLMREVSKLRKILYAQQSGLPERLSVMVVGRDAASPEGVKRAVLNRLAEYGLTDQDDAEQAGCTITVVCLPWLIEREVGNRKDRQEQIDEAPHLNPISRWDSTTNSLNVENT